MAKVYVKFPKTGLGNMMLVWAYAVVFAKINNLEVVTSSWWGFRWGALLRREKKNRLYRNYFKETSLVKRNGYKIKLLFKDTIKDPEILKLSKEEKESKKIFLFQKTIRENDLFKSLRDHQQTIKEEIYKTLNAQKKEELSKYNNPVIAVHIRRGDFKLGNQTTPLSYFINAVNLIRKNTGKVLPVTIFTDAEVGELIDILKLPEVKIAEEKADILDILLMSRSRILLLSKDSTFSYWAAFLSDALVIMHHNDWQDQIRKSSENFVEVKWNDNDPGSKKELEKLIQNLNLE